MTRDDAKASLKRALSDYFGPRRPLIGFSALSGREDLFSLAKELTDEGAGCLSKLQDRYGRSFPRLPEA